MTTPYTSPTNWKPDKVAVITDHLELQQPYDEQSLTSLVEDENTTCVLIRASKFSKTFGRGSRPNFYSLQDFTLEPPPPLSEIDKAVWRRFHERATNAKHSGFYGRHSIPVFLTLIPWSILMIMGDIKDKTDEGVPSWLLVSFIICTVVPFVTGFVSGSKEEEISIKAEQRVVDKMKQTFAIEGYDVEHVATPRCRGKCISCSYVMFHRRASKLIDPSADAVAPDDSMFDTFESYYWSRLEGAWKLSNSSFREKGDQCPDWCVNIPKNTARIRISGASRPDTFTHSRSASANFCFGLCSKDYQVLGQIEGNCLVFGSRKDMEDLVENANLSEEAKEKLAQVIDYHEKEKSFYPIGESSNGAAFFRNKSGGSVWKVDRLKLVQYHDLIDEHLSTTDILEGVLDDNDKCEREWFEYEKFLESPEDLVEISEFVGAADNATLFSLENRFKWTFAVPFPAAIMFFSCGATADSLQTKYVLWVTGFCAMASSISVCLLQWRLRRSHQWAIFWSAMYLMCLLITLFGLVIKWKELILHAKVPFVVSVIAFLGCFLALAVANLHWCFQWRDALRRNHPSDGRR